MKKSTLRFTSRKNILKSEQNCLQLKANARSTPVLRIMSPVPWKSSKYVAFNRLDQILMVTHPVLQALNMLWHEIYHGMPVINLTKFFENSVPMNADEITTMIHNSCTTFREILLSDWIPRCADLIDVMEKSWMYPVMLKKSHTGKIQMIFNCIHALMSHQLQGLILWNVIRFFRILQKYKDYCDANQGNYKQKPFMLLTVCIVGKHFKYNGTEEAEGYTTTMYSDNEYDPQLQLCFFDRNKTQQTYEVKVTTEFLSKNSGRMLIYPLMYELPDIFVSYFKSIVKIGYKIPRMEKVLSRSESEYGDLFCVSEDHIDLLCMYHNIDLIIQSNWIGPTVYLYPVYNYYFPLLTGKVLTITKRIFTQDKIPEFKDFEKLIFYLTNLMSEIYFLPDFVPLNLFTLDNRHVNKMLEIKIRDVIDLITDYFQILNKSDNKRICDEFEEISMKAGERPRETCDVVNLQNYLNNCRENEIYKLRKNIEIVAKRIMFLLFYGKINANDIHLNSRTLLWLSELEEVLELSSSRLNMIRDNLEIAIRKKRADFEVCILSEKQRIDHFRLRESREILSLDELKDKVESADKIIDVLEVYSKEAKNINNEEKLLQIDQSFFPTFFELVQKMEQIQKLWKVCYEFEKNYKIWMQGSFTTFNSNQIQNKVEDMQMTIINLIQSLTSNSVEKKIAEQYRTKIDKFITFLPVFHAICREGLEDYHWQQISETLGKPCNPTIYPSLKDLIDNGIMNILPQLQEISNTASKEFELCNELIAMQNSWKNVSFKTLPYDDFDTFVLENVDDIQTLLDDHILKSQTMHSSPFITVISDKASDWENKLTFMQDILDLWMQVQSMWVRVAPIFSSQDIFEQMPHEARNFKVVDKSWRKIMKMTNETKTVLEVTDYPNLHAILKKTIKDLESLNKSLNLYVEQKCLYFARFFFLSNKELIKILSEARKPMNLQPYLKKCFEGISSLEFSSNSEITGIISTEGERVPLVRKLFLNNINGLVEVFFKDIEQAMFESIKSQLHEGWSMCFKLERRLWLKLWPEQIIQVISSLVWTSEVEEAITNKQLEKYLQESYIKKENLVELIQTASSHIEHMSIESLIILDIHRCDVINSLIKYKVQHITDFDWIIHLRYYWKQNTTETTKSDNIYINMVLTEICYGLEYLGNFSRLVVTPLTDRCYRTLLSAIKLCLGGSLEGPSGMGKTETCKDLAKAVGKRCVVFNCSSGVDRSTLGKFLKGLAQSGVWICLDEFNRIATNVLSVTAQQILIIQRAIFRRLVKFVFEEITLKLNSTCALFITINPRFTQITNLPDNLQTLFRTVAMIEPDYAMITEITLNSRGFYNARSLSQKIIYAHKLCSEQLSIQSHYDFGITSVQNVLSASCSFRKLYPLLSEEQIVLRAIIDINLPKFLEDDTLLFFDICQDLFPGIETPVLARNDILLQINKIMENENLDGNEWFTDKVLQIYEMLKITQGVIIVGKPMSGKTTICEVLAKTVRLISGEEMVSEVKNPVEYCIINPKALTPTQLYGSFDSVSSEWIDGKFAKQFREMVRTVELGHNWILLDGPIDSMWIETLKSVLDDNKKLCLKSGEVLQMTKSINIIFETNDLDQASPATISRCSVIYMDSNKLDWNIVHKCFLNVLNSYGLNEIYKALYVDIVEWLVPAALEILSVCETMLTVSATQQYKIFSTFFLYLLEQRTQFSHSWFQQAFLFCFVWAYGSALFGNSRNIFDNLIRKILNGTNEKYPRPKHFSLNRGQMFPEKFSILDYRFDETENYWPWLGSEEIILPEHIDIDRILIPTKETNYIVFWLKMCIAKNMPILVIGPTGTSKTATISSHINEMEKDSNIINIINFSARTTSQQVQDKILFKLDRRRKGILGPMVGKKCVIFIDDVALPSRDDYGSQPPLELIRQWLDHSFLYDLKDFSELKLVDLVFVGAMGLLGGSNYIFPRLYRHMFILGVNEFEESTFIHIFATIGNWHLIKAYTDNTSLLAKGLSEAMLHVYKKCAEFFLPTPEKTHYNFSLRDITRVVQGIVLVPAKKLVNLKKLVHLWLHETLRVFHDCLIQQNEKIALFTFVRESFTSYLKTPLEQVSFDQTISEINMTDDDLFNVWFCNFMEPDAEPKIYDEVEDYEKLEKIMNYYLKEYNDLHHSEVDLILFRFIIEHISRISRVLQIPRGHILIIGVGGSGRKISAKLAAHVAGNKLMTVNLSNKYTRIEWRDDIMKILIEAGTATKPITFLFSDTQVIDEDFVDDISSILYTGELSHPFSVDEKAEILERIKKTNCKTDLSSASMYGCFIEQIRQTLHLVLVFSPIGDSFKERFRMYPSLIRMCTVDWFTEWPKCALIRIAETFIKTLHFHGIDSKVDKSETEIEKESLETRLIDMFLYFNNSTSETSNRYFRELSRHNYVMPISYLELLKYFKSFYNKKHSELKESHDRYSTGLNKLDDAASQVCDIQENLFKLQPRLKVLSDETEKIMVNIERETAEAEKKKEVVGAEEAAANEAAATAQAIKDDCESDLQEAIPALEAALEALKILKPADITVVKSMKNPPLGVKLVLEAVCVLKGIKPDRKPDSSGKIIDDYWGPSLRMLGDLKFLDSLKFYDKDNIPSSVMKKIREKYIPDRDFIPEKIKTVSTACEGLCKWVRAIDIYDKVVKIVAPKKLALASAETELAQQMEKLNAKRKELQEILDKLQKLNDYFSEKSREKKGLEDEIDYCEKRLDRAEKLLGGLSGEKIRWLQAKKELIIMVENVVGDVLLAAGFVAYLGAFTNEYRNNILSDWKKQCLTKNIRHCDDFSLENILGNSTEIRSWTLEGFGLDSFSIENAIIIKNSLRCPLIVDPQGEANRCIRNFEKNNNLKIIRLGNETYMREIETAIENGYPVLLENIDEKIDIDLWPILERNVFKHNNRYVIKIGDKLVNFNQNFRFYITTYLKNPHYSPEFLVMVTFLNFMITEQGLQEQLLSITIEHDRPDLQKLKKTLISEAAKNHDTLYTIETKILQVLSSSERNILEDEKAITILSSSKAFSDTIQQKQTDAAVTEVETDASRQKYMPVAKHCAVLFFCVTELANINPMYECSLVWFVNLFSTTILKTSKNDSLQKRLDEINNNFTKMIYQNVCRSLFEKDKLLLSFIMCISLLMSKEIFYMYHLMFLFSKDDFLDYSYPNPPSSWLNDKMWIKILRASELNGLEGFHKHVSENLIQWKNFYENPDPNDFNLPTPYENVNGMLQLIIIKCIRPDKLLPAIMNFITLHMGKFFVEPPLFDIQESFLGSSATTPLIFILSSNLDPMRSLLTFAKKKQMYDKCRVIPLGQGQEERTEKVVLDGIQNGFWVVLQNCHLDGNCMSKLENLFMDTALIENSHNDFRLWCTSRPSKTFPILILRNSVKITNELPQGLKRQMLQSFNSEPLISDKFFSNAFVGKAAKSWLRGVFALVFFNAVIQERKEFGPIGWNISYDFNEADLKISLLQLKIFIKEYGSIPHHGFVYLTGECNYGGRVTDKNDRRLLLCLLETFYNENSINVNNYCIARTTWGKYTMPVIPNRINSIQYVKTFPINSYSEVFRLHENADIIRNNRKFETVLNDFLLCQKQLVSENFEETSKITSDSVFVRCVNILNKLPEQFILDQITAKYPVVYTNSMNNVLKQEILRFNQLLEYIRVTLINVKKTIKGQISVSPEFFCTYEALVTERLPEGWLRKSYPSSKPIGGYIDDLLKRLGFFQQWIDYGQPSVYWLPGFYFIQSFITAVQQNFSRKNKFQIELITVQYEISKFKQDDPKSSEAETFTEGLFLEGARWNCDTHCLDECLPKILYDSLPVIKITPILNEKIKESNEKKYDCPVYHTYLRREISNLGPFNNFIMYIQLDSKIEQSHWINRGTACLCQLND